MSDGSPIPAALARKNLVLGLILGGLSLALMVAFIIIFTHSGLPKDPKEWQRLQAARAAAAAAQAPQAPAAAPAPSAAPAPAPAPAAPAESAAKESAR